jgi:gliding motility-associated lipoprotein GldH
MKRGLIFLFLALALFSCNRNKIYQEYVDFDKRIWLSSESARFRFDIRDTLSSYNIYCNLRNSTHYPWSRIFINFALTDTAGNALEKKLVNDYLFDPKTGKPHGRSGLGDLYDHRIQVLSNYRFPESGSYEVTFDQFMRTDSLAGILSVGLAIEAANP